MAQSRFFTSTAIPTVLSAAMTSAGNPVVPVVTGLPASYPFEIVVDLGIYSGATLIQEAMLVTSAPVNNGNGTWTLPVTRGIDGTTAQAHTINATVVHVALGQDFNDTRAHVDNVSGVHGVTGAVVGTTDTQTLTNKILVSPVLGTAVVSADPTSPLGVADKAYVDAETIRATAVEALLAPAGSSGSGTVNSGAIAAAGIYSTTITVTGAATGQTVSLGLPSTWGTMIIAGVVVTAYISAANTVTVVLKNTAATSQTPPSATVNVKTR